VKCSGKKKTKQRTEAEEKNSVLCIAIRRSPTHCYDDVHCFCIEHSIANDDDGVCVDVPQSLANAGIYVQQKI
jgi:hypothetical protein